ncbi:MAG: class I SAM-dependent methyltransferase [Rubellimicrobium sp.]|nr:class I SAM-dependent methyltransferase [Rubellimicrobium sp.]
MSRYRLTPELSGFAAKGVNEFDGMLNKSAAVVAALATTIIREDTGWEDRAFLEIGVYKGKFFSLVERATKGTDALLLGVDPFRLPDQSMEAVLQTLSLKGCDMDRIVLHKGLSSEEGEIVRLLGKKKLSLCHVDGSHREDDVIADLHMIDRLAADDAIIIGDDFWNRSQLQVTTAFFRTVLADKIDLKPFMLSNNKIYLCRERFLKSNSDKFIEAFETNRDRFSLLNEWLQRAENEQRHHTRQKMAQWEVIII